MRVCFLMCAIAVAGLSIVARGQMQDGAWGEDVSGMRVGVELWRSNYGPRTTDFHPGEPMKVTVTVRYDPARVTHAPHVSSFNFDLHLRTPAGTEYIYNPHHVVDSKPLRVVHDWIPLQEGQNPPIIQDAQWRLAEGLKGWIDARTREPVGLSMRQPGVYKLWAVFEVTPGIRAPANAWRGRAISREVEFTISDLPPERRLAQATLIQRSRMAALFAGRDYLEGDRRPLEDELKADLAAMENEGLALQLVAATRESRSKAKLAISLLFFRASDHDHTSGIDGPYLKMLADAAMDAAEAQEPEPGEPSAPPRHFALVYYRLHPEDEEFRRRLVALARRFSRIERWRKEMLNQYQSPLEPAPQAPHELALFEAWSILLLTGELRDGITLEEARALLGTPTYERAGRISWYPYEEAQTNPGVEATLRGGKLEKWRVDHW